MEYTTHTLNEAKSRCVTTHIRSGKQWTTDIPVALGGYGENATPGEMLASVVASCMMSMVSFLAARKNVDTEGMTIDARAEDKDGSIVHLYFLVKMPLPGTHALRKTLEQASETCPVRKSLSDKVAITTEWIWQ